MDNIAHGRILAYPLSHQFEDMHFSIKQGSTFQQNLSLRAEHTHCDNQIVGNIQNF